MSYPKKINVTFDVSNVLEEENIRTHLESIGGKYIKTLPNTDHLKDNTHFKKFMKSKKDLEKSIYEFINNNRI